MVALTCALSAALRIRQRMENIYGASQSHVSDRIAVTTAVRERFLGVLSLHELSFLTQLGHEPAVPQAAPTRKRGPYKKRKNAAQADASGPHQKRRATDDG